MLSTSLRDKDPKEDSCNDLAGASEEEVSIGCAEAANNGSANQRATDGADHGNRGDDSRADCTNRWRIDLAVDGVHQCALSTEDCVDDQESEEEHVVD